jgi:uncharacterized membrane protein
MRHGLIALGIVILFIAWVFGSLFSAQSRAQLQTASSLCNSGLGTIGSSLSYSIAQNCQQVNTINTLLSIDPIVYFVGFIILVAGLVTSKKQTETKGNKESSNNYDSDKDDPVRLLKQRYAKGLITKKQYDQMRKDLE